MQAIGLQNGNYMFYSINGKITWEYQLEEWGYNVTFYSHPPIEYLKLFIHSNLWMPKQLIEGEILWISAPTFKIECWIGKT